MDTPTRIAIGAGAVFAIAGIATPFLGWPIAGPIMGVCGLVALWGFWPVISIPRWHLRLPLQRAAQTAYEKAEKEGWLSRAVMGGSEPQERLNSFKYMFLADPLTHFRGVSPPSTKARDIPRADIGHTNEGQWHLDVHPIPGESRLNRVWPKDKVAFENVTVAKRDLWRLLRDWRRRVANGQNPE